MGIDYARATLPYAVRGITDGFTNESLYDLILALHEHKSEELTTPFDFLGWTYTYWDGDYKNDPNDLWDSAKHNNHPYAHRLVKDDMQVWLVREGHVDDPYYSVGAETLESLNAFLSDIGLPDAPVDEIENALAKHFVKMAKELDYEEWIAYLAIWFVEDESPMISQATLEYEKRWLPVVYHVKPKGDAT